MKMSKKIIAILLVFGIFTLFTYLYYKRDSEIQNLFYEILKFFKLENLNVVSEERSQTKEHLPNYLERCLYNVENDLKIAKRKMPETTKVKIIDYKNFTTKEEIEKWTKIYFHHPLAGSINCDRLYIDPTGLCSDYLILKNKSISISYGKIIGIGVAIKKETIELGGVYSFVYPIFCDENGNIMPNSKNFLETILI